MQYISKRITDGVLASRDIISATCSESHMPFENAKVVWQVNLSLHAHQKMTKHERGIVTKSIFILPR